MEDLCKVRGMFVDFACIWKTCVRFEGCLFTVHVYGRLVQGLKGCLITVHVYERVV